MIDDSRTSTIPVEPAPATAVRDAALHDGRTGSPLLHISNAMVRLYKEAYGRGPTKARAQFAGPDTLVVILEDSMTVVDRNLAAMGEHERLRENRLFFQLALEDRFRDVIERALGRRTIAFVSGIDTRHDVAVEVFTLEPQPGSHPIGRDPNRSLG
ncbi:MAG TPA: Na-translocating system protein MpsC family protein [Solirubrobacteraceae bacterium]|nr:Na-translocating system protein MpsC family protein [Solirubrobacteraceae bacterium]